MKKIPEKIDAEMEIDFSTHFRSGVRSILLTREFTSFNDMTIDWWADLFTDVFEEAMRTWNDGVKRFEHRHPELQEDDDEELVESGAFDNEAEEENKALRLEIEALEEQLGEAQTLLREREEHVLIVQQTARNDAYRDTINGLRAILKGISTKTDDNLMKREGLGKALKRVKRLLRDGEERLKEMKEKAKE